MSDFNRANNLFNMNMLQVSQIQVVPTNFPTLLKIPTEKPGILDHLRLLYVSGAPIPPHHADAFAKTMPGVTLQRCKSKSANT